MEIVSVVVSTETGEDDVVGARGVIGVVGCPVVGWLELLSVEIVELE